MKKAALLLLLCTLTLAAGAQSRFGHLSYRQALQSMPAYAEAQADLDKLRDQYNAEMTRAEDEFNKKYEEFLEGQNDFAPSIRNKRQSELQELMQKNIAFKQEARRLLDKAEKEAIEPLRHSLDAAITSVAHGMGLAFVLNTDNNAVPYVDETMGLNITEHVRQILSR